MIEPVEARALLSTLWVTDPGDNGGIDPAPFAGTGTLRQAIVDADATAGASTIDFNLGSGGHQVITLNAALPPITNSVTIDGTTQPGYVNNSQPIMHGDHPANFSPGPAWTLAQPLVEIQDSGRNIALLHIEAGNCTIKGLVLGDTGSVPDFGIAVHGGSATIQGNYIGTDWTGTVAAPFNYGVAIFTDGVRTPAATIGGTSAGQGNLISGATNYDHGDRGVSGVYADPGGPTVTIQGNFIGTDASGTHAVGNTDGIIPGDFATIGGTAAGAGNLISGNTTGIGAGNGPMIQGNLIGTDITGTAAIPNGIGTFGGSPIGGTVAGADNLISGNTVGIDAGYGALIQGNLIGTDITGTEALCNVDGIKYIYAGCTIGGTTAAARNIISGNTDYEIFLCGASLIEGNYIGTDITGESVPLGSNYAPGLYSLDGATIGGTVAGAGNLIAGSAGDILAASNTLFQGNTIGTNKGRTLTLGGNPGYIVLSFNLGYGNTIGGTVPGAGNFIRGVVLLDGSPATGNIIEGNDIDAIALDDGANDNQIGGTDPGAGNIIGHLDMYQDASPTNTHEAGKAILGNTFDDPKSKPITMRVGNSDVGAVNHLYGTVSGPDGPQNYPVLTFAGAGTNTTVIGTLNSSPNDTFRVEFFASPAGDPPGQGRATRYLGYTNVTTDASGNASFTATGLGTSAVGEEITATAMVLTGLNANSTSEFSVWIAATLPPPSSLSGVVFSDFNDDGQVDFGEQGIPGVPITLTGTDFLGNAVSLSQNTDADGTYVFQGLLPGTYTITETQQPSGYTPGINTVGTGGGTVPGAQFTVAIEASQDAMNYNYGEQPAATGPIQKGQTAGIGFWNNKNGQVLIKSLNGGTGHQLGDWLAATFPHLFGALAGSNNLTGKSNAFIAAQFQADFVGLGTKLDAQVLATALAVYVTDPTLDNTGAGTQYGFLVGGNGVATATYNVGSNGGAFGVANNTVMTVLDILLAADALAVNGVLYNGDATKRNQANTVFSAINEAGGL